MDELYTKDLDKIKKIRRAVRRQADQPAKNSTVMTDQAMNGVGDKRQT